MTTNMSNTPSPDFRAQLEWEITRSFRRESRLGASRRERRSRRLRAIALVTLCIAVGTTTGIASAQVRDYTRRDSLLDAARAELLLVRVRLNVAQGQFLNAKMRQNAGAIDAAAVASAEAEVRSMEALAARTQLNIDEIQVGSQAPRDELNAPLVGGRDFVKDRIQLDLVAAQQRLNASERAVGEAIDRVRAGAASDVSRLEAQLAMEHARGTLGILAERLSLRREFIEKGLTADQLAIRLESAQVREDIRVAQQSLVLANERVKLIERQHNAGAASDLDLMRAQVEVKERELELSQLAVQLKRLGTVNRDST